jgi:hypothetical protein
MRTFLALIMKKEEWLITSRMERNHDKEIRLESGMKKKLPRPTLPPMQRQQNLLTLFLS